jgi:hypothetical protein
MADLLLLPQISDFNLCSSQFKTLILLKILRSHSDVAEYSSVLAY